MLPIQPGRWNDLFPGNTNRFYGTEFFYSIGCVHLIRLISFANKEVCNSHCVSFLADSVAYGFKRRDKR